MDCQFELARETRPGFVLPTVCPNGTMYLPTDKTSVVVVDPEGRMTVHSHSALFAGATIVCTRRARHAFRSMNLPIVLSPRTSARACPNLFQFTLPRAGSDAGTHWFMHWNQWFQLTLQCDFHR